MTDSLSKQKDGKGHWKPELASDSEEMIRADREFSQTTNRRENTGSGPASEAHIRELQERTKRHAEEKTKAGTSPRDPAHEG